MILSHFLLFQDKPSFISGDSSRDERQEFFCDGFIIDMVPLFNDVQQAGIGNEEGDFESKLRSFCKIFGILVKMNFSRGMLSFNAWL